MTESMTQEFHNFQIFFPSASRKLIHL